MSSIESNIKEHVIGIIQDIYQIQLEDLVIEIPPRPEFGDMALPAAFELAKRLSQTTGQKQNPRKLAETIVARLPKSEGITKIEIAGPGYINIFLDRADYVTTLAQPRQPSPPTGGKIIIEHTSINPNKAAHIGHLRNALLGDTLVRLLRSIGKRVEAHNYIDNTGVQVADVVVGFMYIEKKSLDEIQQIPGKFDYYCWDLYSQVTDWYAQNPDNLAYRNQTLKEVEIEGHPTSQMADYISTRIVNCHLDTLERLGIHYDLLPRESDILHLHFWDLAFEILKQTGVVVYETEGRSQGCWVMRAEARPQTSDLSPQTSDLSPQSSDLSPQSSVLSPQSSATSDPDYEADKILVRSNGTVNYTGKDIAYHLWKLGKLGVDFNYKPFRTYPDKTEVWMTTSDASEHTRETRPMFGVGTAYLNVIGSEQTYLQNFVREAVGKVATDLDVNQSAHVSYEKVSLSPQACLDLGMGLSPDDLQRQQISMSGRRGLGVKADDLIDKLEEGALKEVRSRHPHLPEAEQWTVAHKIAIGALRYFLLKYTRTATITFDFKEALSFEGETGPYLQYAVVRAQSIFRKIEAAGLARRRINEISPEKLRDLLGGKEVDEVWSLIYLAGRLDQTIRQACDNLEPALVAKHAFQLAQKFNVFYHNYPILREPDQARQLLLITITEMVERQLQSALDLMGIEVPEKM